MLRRRLHNKIKDLRKDLRTPPQKKKKFPNSGTKIMFESKKLARC